MNIPNPFQRKRESDVDAAIRAMGASPNEHLGINMNVVVTSHEKKRLELEIAELMRSIVYANAQNKAEEIVRNFGHRIFTDSDNDKYSITYTFDFNNNLFRGLIMKWRREEVGKLKGE